MNNYKVTILHNNGSVIVPKISGEVSFICKASSQQLATRLGEGIVQNMNNAELLKRSYEFYEVSVEEGTDE